MSDQSKNGDDFIQKWHNNPHRSHYQQQTLDSLVTASSILTQSLRVMSSLNAQLVECGCLASVVQYTDQMSKLLVGCHTLSISMESRLKRAQKQVALLLPQGQTCSI